MATLIERFTTNNYYLKYNLYEHLNDINSSIFTSGCTFLIEYDLTAFSASYVDEPYIKITPSNPYDVNYFRKNTYVKLNSNISYKTLIVDIVPNEYMIIETYKSDTGITITSISTIYDLYNISDILYDVFKNDESSYYRIRSDNQRKDISNAYAKFISEDTNIIDQTTGILMLDDQNKFILKLYDTENSLNGGYVRSPVVITNDSGSTIPTNLIKTKSAILGGEITDDGGSTITAMGLVYSSTNSIPTLNDSLKSESIETGWLFTTYLMDLIDDKLYYYRAYAVNRNSVSYGSVLTFMTLSASTAEPPTVYTEPIKSTTSDTIILDMTVLDTGWIDIGEVNLQNPDIIERGICFMLGSGTPNRTDDSYVYLDYDDGKPGTYTISIISLSSGTYSVRAYAYASDITNIGYGDTIEVTI